FLRPGDRVVSIKDTYGGTNKIFTEFLPKLDIEIELCETGNHEAMENEIKKGCRLIHLETPTNPTVKITDIERIAELAREQDALLV
ncbi:PLP-dependent transferase, partial [Salinicoccus roseus]